MNKHFMLQVLFPAVLLAACAGGGQSGVCIPGGGCAPRYPDARELSNANLEVYEDDRIGGLAQNMGLPDIHPDAVCEAAASGASLDDVQDGISDLMADRNWDNVIGWGYGSSVWQNRNTYAYILSWDLDPEQKLGSMRHEPPLETLGIQESELEGDKALTITCVFKQPAR